MSGPLAHAMYCRCSAMAWTREGGAAVQATLASSLKPRVWTEVTQTPSRAPPRPWLYLGNDSPALPEAVRALGVQVHALRHPLHDLPDVLVVRPELEHHPLERHPLRPPEDLGQAKEVRPRNSVG
jgi:hypothetical protein